MLLAGLAVLAILALGIFIIPIAYADYFEVVIEPVLGSGISGCQYEDGCYIPMIATVDYGGTVIFINTDNVAHTFTSGTPDEGPSGIFDSGLAIVGSSFEWQADRIGEIPHFCIVHPWQTGLIIVQGNPTIDKLPDINSDDLQPIIVSLIGLISDLTDRIESLEERIAMLEIELGLADYAFVEGYAYFDRNGNEIFDYDESELEGITVIVSDATTGDIVSISESDGGQYSILLEPGDYLVVFTSSVDDTISTSIDLTVSEGQNIRQDVGFDTMPEPQTGIEGKAYTDTNNNNRYDAGEPLLSEIPILSINLSDHADVERDRTNANGEYFIERDAGSYLVQVEFTNSFAYLDVRAGSVTIQNLGVP